MVNIQSLTGAGKKKGTYVEVSNFMDLKGHSIRVAAGNKKGSNGKASTTETIKTDGDGNVSFNQAFLFLAQPGAQACEVSVKQKGMLGASEYGKLTIGLEQQKTTGALKVKDATLAIQTTFVDLDVGVSALINSYRRAAREAELRAIAERERQEAEGTFLSRINVGSVAVAAAPRCVVIRAPSFDTHGCVSTFQSHTMPCDSTRSWQPKLVCQSLGDATHARVQGDGSSAA